MAALIGLAVAGAAGSFWQASKAQKAQEDAQRAQEALAKEQATKEEQSCRRRNGTTTTSRRFIWSAPCSGRPNYCGRSIAGASCGRVFSSAT